MVSIFSHQKTEEECKRDLENGYGKDLDDVKPVVQPSLGVGPPEFTMRAAKKYAKERATQLIPSKEFLETNKYLLNPIPALREVNGKQWYYILLAFLAWSADALDFFSVVMNVDKFSTDLNATTKQITWGTTVVLMLRTVGAFFFGYLGDKFGSKWPFVVNLFLMCVIQIGMSFIKTYQQFLGVRAVFGIIMGGIYGNATSTALDDLPPIARGVISGLVQQGYAFGYLIAVVFTRAIADTQRHSWRAMYWTEAGITFLIACGRIILPQTNHTKRMLLEKKMKLANGIKEEGFEIRAAKAFKTYWLMFVYLVLLMAGFNFMSHGSQDLYPTFLKEQLAFSNNRATVTNCVANLGALAGGLVVGHLSNYLGRRLCIMVCCVGGGALIYPWAFVTNNGIDAAAFFLQFFVQGAFGVIPAHLSELSHPDFRSFIVGISYQLGNLASSASSTIETTIGEQFKIISPTGETIFNYGKVMAIFMGCVFGYVLLITFVGPENRSVVSDIAENKQMNLFFDNEKPEMELLSRQESPEDAASQQERQEEVLGQQETQSESKYVAKSD